MKLIRRSIAGAALTLTALLASGAFAQSSGAQIQAAAESAPASAPAAAAPLTGPRLRSAAETGNRAAAPGDLHPERPVAPQINIPFGKKTAPATKAEERSLRRGGPVAKGAVDDSAARCESQTDEQNRAVCRARIARESKGKSDPN